MPPRLNLLATSRALPVRTRPPIQRWRPSAMQCRYFADSKDLPVSHDKKGPNTDTSPHVSEEAAAIGKVTGEGGPDLQQGTPVEEVVKRDQKAQEKLPKIMKDALKASKPSNSRSFSTSAIRWQDSALSDSNSSSAPLDPTIVESGTSIITDPSTTEISKPGIKFGLPSIPIPSDHNLHHRYDPIIDQFTGLLIQHGKKGVAQRNVSLILSHLRTSPPPKLNPARPLLPGHPPASHLPLNPILYLQLAIDSVSPLLRIRSQRGAAGGGVALQLPIPLGLRRRRWTAIKWILDAASKRRNRGSGKGMFAQRVGEELVAVVEGRSTVWTKRDALHKLGVAARANMNQRSFKRR